MEHRTLPAAPIAVADEYTLPEATAINVAVAGVLSNDTDPDANQFTAHLQNGPSHGILSLNPDGSFIYTPNEGFVGTDQFTYLARDTTNLEDEATVTLNVVADAAPVVADEEIAAFAGEPIVLNVLANDSDPDGDDLFLVSVTSAVFGAVTIQSGSGTLDTLRYTADPEFLGLETLTYTVRDELGRTTIGKVTVRVSERAAPEIEGLGLVVDTHFPNDLVTTDARLAGSVVSTRSADVIAVEFDYDGDGDADASTTVDSANGNFFVYNIGPDINYGAVTVHVRAIETPGGDLSDNVGQWQTISFTYVESHPVPNPPTDPDPNAPVITDLQVDESTTALVRLTGQVTDNNGGAAPTVEFDVDFDGTADITAVLTSGAFSQVFTTQVGYGDKVIAVRAVDWDGTAGANLYGEWALIDFFRPPPPNAAPEVTGLELVNDTDTADDNITSDPRVSGTATNSDGQIVGLTIEYDLTGDGFAEGHVETNISGVFTINPDRSLLADGPVTIKVRAREWDANTNGYVRGDWVSFNFEYTGNAAARPRLEDLELVNDTDTAGDNITSDPRIGGTFVGNLAAYETLAVHYDLNLDGITDGVVNAIDPVTGAFVLDLSNLGLVGEVTISLRAWGFDGETVTTAVGDWQDFTFTYESPPPLRPTVTEIGLVNDTDTPNDGITRDPTLAGIVVRTDGSVAGLPVQYDIDGDGEAEGTVYADPSGTGEFTVDLSDAGLSGGVVTVRLRAGVWVTELLNYDYGAWSEFSFTYEVVPNIPPAVTGLVLLNDSDGDGVTSQPTIGGTVTNDGDVALLPVEFDINGDGNAEGIAYTDVLGTGEFQVDLSPHLTNEGEYTVRFRAAEFNNATGEYVFGAWHEFTFSYETAPAPTSPEESLEDDDDLPFTTGQMSQAVFDTGALWIGVNVDSVNAESAATFLAGYVAAGAFEIGSGLFAPIGNVSIDETNNTNAPPLVTSDGNGGTFTVDPETTWHLTVTGILHENGEWYRYEVFTTTYTIETWYEAADGSGYHLIQSGSYGYTLVAYGYNGNAVYAIEEDRTDSYVNEQWTATAPSVIHTIAGYQDYSVDAGGLKKVNGDGLVAPGSTASWLPLVNEVNPLIFDTNYLAMGNGVREFYEYGADGSVDYDGDWDEAWAHWYYAEADTPAGGAGTTLGEEFEYAHIHHDPYNMTNVVTVNTNVTVGGVTTITDIDESTSLIGAETRKYAADGIRVTNPDGTYSSTVNHGVRHDVHDVYKYTAANKLTVTDNSVAGATTTRWSEVDSTTNRTRDFVDFKGTTTIRTTAGIETTNGEVDSSNESVYDYTSTQKMHAEGTKTGGGTIMSFTADGSVEGSGNGLYLGTRSGTFGDAGLNITNTISDMETGETIWTNSAESHRETVYDDGKGNFGESGSDSSTSGESGSSFTNTIDVTEWVKTAGVTSSGTLTHISKADSANEYSHSSYSSDTTTTDEIGLNGWSERKSSSYSKGKSTYDEDATGTGTVLNGGTTYTEIAIATEKGTFSSGSESSYEIHSEDTHQAGVTKTIAASGDQSYDEEGDFNSESVTTRNNYPDGKTSSNSVFDYTKTTGTKWDNSSKSSTEIDDTSSPGTTRSVSSEDTSTDKGSGSYKTVVHAEEGTATNGTSTSSNTTTDTAEGSGETTSSYSSTSTSITGGLTPLEGVTDPPSVGNIVGNPNIGEGEGSYTFTGHNNGSGVTSFSYSTSTVTNKGSGTYSFDSEDVVTTINGVTTSTKTAESESDSSSKLETQNDRLSIVVDASKAGITATVKQWASDTNETTTTEHLDSNSEKLGFANGTNYSHEESYASTKTEGTWSNDSDVDEKYSVNNVGGVTSTKTRHSHYERSGDVNAFTDTTTTTDHLPNGAWSKEVIATLDSTTNDTEDSSTDGTFDSTDTSAAGHTKTIHATNHSAVTNATTTVETGSYSKVITGSAGGSTEGWSEENTTGDGTIDFNSSQSVRDEENASNFEEISTNKSGDGSFTITGESRADRFTNGTDSSSSTYTREETGNYSKTDIKTSKKNVTSTPMPGLTQTSNAHVSDTAHWTDVTYTDTFNHTTNDPVNGPLVSTTTTTLDESGKQDWNSFAKATAATTGTVNSPGSENHGLTINNSSKNTDTENGKGSFHSYHKTVTTETGGNTSNTSSDESSLKGSNLLTNEAESKSSTSRTWTEQGMNISVSQVSDEKSFGRVSIQIDDSSSTQTNAAGKVTGTSKSAPATTGNAYFRSSSSETVNLSKGGEFSSNRTKTKSDSGWSSFNASLSHMITSDEGKITHSGSGTSNTQGESHSKSTYYNTTTTEKYSVSKGGTYKHTALQDRLDVKDSTYSGNAAVTINADGTETWSGSQTSEVVQKQKYLDRTDSTRKVNDLLNTLFGTGNYTEINDWFEEKTHKEDRKFKEVRTVQADGSLSAPETNTNGYADDAVILSIESRKTSGKDVIKTWDGTTTSPGTLVVTHKETHEVSGGAGESHTYVQWGNGDMRREQRIDGEFNRTETKLTTNTYYPTSSQSVTTHTKNESSKSGVKMSIRTDGELAVTVGYEHATSSYWKKDSSSKGGSTSISNYTDHFDYPQFPFNVTSTVNTKWSLSEVEVKESTFGEIQSREEGSNRTDVIQWSTFDETYKFRYNVDTTSKTVGSHTNGGTVHMEGTEHFERATDAEYHLKFERKYFAEQLEVDENGDGHNDIHIETTSATLTESITYNDTGTADSLWSGNATIDKFHMYYEEIDTNGDGIPDDYNVWYEPEDFSGFAHHHGELTQNVDFSRTWIYGQAQPSDFDPYSTYPTTGGYYDDDLDTPEFWGSHVENALTPAWYFLMPYEDFRRWYQDSDSNGWGGVSTEWENTANGFYTEPNFVMFEEVEDPAWWEELGNDISDFFTSNFPDLAAVLGGIWNETNTILSGLWEEFDNGTMFDRAFGFIDGFFNAINPLDQWASIPDIGPVFGHVEAYEQGKIVGTVAGIVTGIAISFFGPGLVSCGTWAHKALVGWELANAAGGIASGAQAFKNGTFGPLDALNVAGSLMSLGSLRSLANKCFVGETLVVCSKELVPVNAMAEATPATDVVSDAPAAETVEESDSDVRLAALAGGILLLAGTYAGVRRDGPKSRERRRPLGQGISPPPDEEPFTDYAFPPEVEPFTDDTFPPEDEGFANAGFRNLVTDTRESPRDAAAESIVVCDAAFAVAMPKEEKTVSSTTSRQSTSAPRSWLNWLLMLTLLPLAGLCFWQADPASLWASRPVARGDVPTSAAKQPVAEHRIVEQLRTRSIREMSPGMRVLANNPELAGEDIPPLQVDPNEWRLVQLEMRKANGGILHIQLLRSLEWLEESGALAGTTVELDLEELGAAGEATVTRIGPCPPIEQGVGRIVTGTFHHTAANVIDLRVSGQAEPIGTTSNHPFWSEDRQAFVPAGELCIGEELCTLGGSRVRVLTKTPRDLSEPVYNLEVEGEHAYYVGDTGVLVHNGCEAVYQLVNSKNEVVYIGIVKNQKRLAERVAEHAADGKKFVKMQLLEKNLTHAQARTKEAKLIHARLQQARTAGKINDTMSIQKQLKEAGLQNKNRGRIPSNWVNVDAPDPTKFLKEFPR